MQGSKVDPFKSYIDQRLEKFNLTGEKIYLEIQRQGYAGRYGIVNKYVSAVKKKLNTKAVLRFETLPGEQSQVDWAYFGDFYDQIERFKHEDLIILTRQYELSKVVYRNVMIDSHFQFETNRYSVPYQYVKKEVVIKKEGQRIEIYYHNNCIARHELSQKIHQIITHPVHLQGLKEERFKFYKARPKAAKDNRYDVMARDLSIYDEVLQ